MTIFKQKMQTNKIKMMIVLEKTWILNQISMKIKRKKLAKATKVLIKRKKLKVKKVLFFQMIVLSKTIMIKKEKIKVKKGKKVEVNLKKLKKEKSQLEVMNKMAIIFMKIDWEQKWKVSSIYQILCSLKI